MKTLVTILALGAGAYAGTASVAFLAPHLPDVAKGPTAGAVTAGTFAGLGAFAALQLVK